MHIKIQECVFYRRLLSCHQELIMLKTSRILQRQRKSAKRHAKKYYNKSEYQLFSLTTLITYHFINYMDSSYLHYQKIQRMNILGSSFVIRQEMRFYLLTYAGRNKTRIKQISLTETKKIHQNERIFHKL